MCLGGDKCKEKERSRWTGRRTTMGNGHTLGRGKIPGY